MTTLEYVFDIKNAEHIRGTNRYTFPFPEAMRNVPNQGFSIGIRSMRLVYTPLNFMFQSLIIHPEGNQNFTMDATLYVMLNSNESMISFNDKLERELKKLYDSYVDSLNEARYREPGDIYPNFFNSEVYTIYYNTIRTSLVIGVGDLSKYYIDFKDGNITNQNFDFLIGVNADFWTDFYNMTRIGTSAMYNAFRANHADEMKHIEITFRTINSVVDYGKPVRFEFLGIKTREALLIKSSVVGLSNNQTIGFTDSFYAPMKLFQIKSMDNKFWVDLYDSINNKEVELSDNDLFYIDTVIMLSDRVF
jgi:hypothetical protein